MDKLIRNIALFVRKRSDKRNVTAVLQQFDEWRSQLEQLPKNIGTAKKIAVIRLDDIGDYLLWHNFLSAYKAAPQFSDYKITLIGNIVWKPIFEAYDANTVDATVWIDKHQYFASELYRFNVWQQLRNEQFEIAVCPAHTRPLLLDDCIALATDAKRKIACANSFAFQEWNVVSDQCYNELFPNNTRQHEFLFNRDFANQICGLSIGSARPTLPKTETKVTDTQSIICFIGASAKSKTWPINYWISLVKLLQQNGYKPLLSGGKNEKELAAQIVAATQAASIVGETDLINTLKAIGRSKAVITGDTMAAHAGVSLGKATVILANGVNAKRFVAYEENGFNAVKTVYTQQYSKSTSDSKVFNAVTKDMQTISPEKVFAALQDLLR